MGRSGKLMIRLPRRMLATTLVFCGLNAPSGWAACDPPKLLNEIQMMPAINSTLELVPVTINGKKRPLLLDTGGAATALTLGATTELNLQPQLNQGPRSLDVSGNIVNRTVTVGTFTMGRFSDSRASFSVMASPALEAIGAAGLVAGDLLFDNDFELDFNAHVLRQFLPDHCGGAVVGWENATLGVMPMRIVAGHIQIEVALDGHPFDAIIDTGADVSVLRQSAADSVFGQAVDWSKDAASDPVNGDQAVVGHYHTFAQLSFGDVAIAKPRLLVMPDRMAARSLGTMHTRMPILIVGMDVLRHFRAYFAVGEGKLHIAASPQVTLPAYGQGSPLIAHTEWQRSESRH